MHTSTSEIRWTTSTSSPPHAAIFAEIYRHKLNLSLLQLLDFWRVLAVDE